MGSKRKQEKREKNLEHGDVMSVQLLNAMVVLHIVVQVENKE